MHREPPQDPMTPWKPAHAHGRSEDWLDDHIAEYFHPSGIGIVRYELSDETPQRGKSVGSDDASGQGGSRKPGWFARMMEGFAGWLERRFAEEMSASDDGDVREPRRRICGPRMAAGSAHRLASVLEWPGKVLRRIMDLRKRGGRRGRRRVMEHGEVTYELLETEH